MLGYNSRIRHKIGKFNRRFSGDPPSTIPPPHAGTGVFEESCYSITICLLGLGPGYWALHRGKCIIYRCQVRGNMSYFGIGNLYLLKRAVFFTIYFFHYNPKHSLFKLSWYARFATLHLSCLDCPWFPRVQWAGSGCGRGGD